MSIDYYVRMERGNLAGVSDRVLEGVANALQLDDAEREHLRSLAQAAGPTASRRPRQAPAAVRPVIQQVLDAITDAPAWVRNTRHDTIAMNLVARALYFPVLHSAAAGATNRRPANTTRFIYLDPAARDFFIDFDRIATDAAAMLRLEAGRHPTTKTSSPWSANYPPNPNYSVSTGPPSTSRSIAAAANGSDTRQSANSTSISKQWNYPPTLPCSSTSTPPTRTPLPLTDSRFSRPGQPPAPPSRQLSTRECPHLNSPLANE